MYSVRHASHFARTSARLRNQEAFRHSARNDPLNDSMKALSVGLPGLESLLGEKIGLHTLGAADVEGLEGQFKLHHSRAERIRTGPPDR